MTASSPIILVDCCKILKSLNLFILRLIVKFIEINKVIKNSATPLFDKILNVFELFSIMIIKKVMEATINGINKIQRLLE